MDILFIPSKMIGRNLEPERLQGTATVFYVRTHTSYPSYVSEYRVTLRWCPVNRPLHDRTYLVSKEEHI